MTENYQKAIIEEFVRFGGRARSAANIIRTINQTFNATKQIKSGPKETILKAILLERKVALEACDHLDDGLKAILYRYLYGTYRKHLEQHKNK